MTTGKQLGPDTIEKSRLVMNLWTITEVANKYNLLDAENNNSGPLNRRWIT